MSVSHSAEEVTFEHLVLTPMIAVEVSVDDSWAKRPRRVQAASGEIHSHQLGDEQRQPNAHRSDESSLVLLRRQHEDRKDQLRGQKHFDKEALYDTGTAAQRRLCSERAREHTADERSSGHPSKNLSSE